MGLNDGAGQNDPSSSNHENKARNRFLGSISNFRITNLTRASHLLTLKIGLKDGAGQNEAKEGLL